MDDSQSVELRDRAGMAMTVLTLQQCWIALPGLEDLPQMHQPQIQIVWLISSVNRISDSIGTSRRVCLVFRVQSGSETRLRH